MSAPVLGFRVRDLDTGEVVLTQTVTGVDLAADAAVYAAETALEYCARTGHPVGLELYDAEGDLAPAREWTPIDRLDPP